MWQTQVGPHPSVCPCLCGAWQYLGHTRPGLVSLLLVSPVSSGKGVLQTIGDGLGANGQLKVEVL